MSLTGKELQLLKNKECQTCDSCMGVLTGQDGIQVLCRDSEPLIPAVTKGRRCIVKKHSARAVVAPAPGYTDSLAAMNRR